MDKKYFSFLVLLFFFACTSKPKEEKINTNPDLFGWTETNISSLRNECIERFGKDLPDSNQSFTQNYCNCFVEKIIHSVKYEQHSSPNDETVKLYSEFSNACRELTKTGDGKQNIQ